MSDATHEHEHIYSVVLGGNGAVPGSAKPWLATCRECGHTEEGDDAPTQIGISWRLGESRDESEPET